MKDFIRVKARELGFDDCRFTTAAPPASAEKLTQWLAQGNHGEMAYLQRNAHKRIDPQQVLTGAKSVLTLATSYSKAGADEASSSDSAPDSGVVARYARFADYHDIIGERLAGLTSFINSLGEDIRSLWYVDTGPLLERDLAQRAGLGFIGKHTNLISRTLGNWIFLSEIITTLELDSDAPEKNRCGSCSRCITACPTQAIRGPFELDARRCISYLTIELKGSIPEGLRPLIGNRIYGCDDCLEVCPWNRFAQQTRETRFQLPSQLATMTLRQLAILTEDEFTAKKAQILGL